MKFFKNLTVFGWLTVASALFAFIGMIIFIVTSTSGYLVGQSMNAWPVVCSLFAILFVAALLKFGSKMKFRLDTVVFFVILTLLVVSFVLFVLARIENFSDVYFIPLTPPAAEVKTVNTSIAGFVFYLLSVATLIAAAFGKRLQKEA